MKNVAYFLAAFVGIATAIYFLDSSEPTNKFVKPSKVERIAQRFDQDFERKKDPALNDVPLERLAVARKYKDQLVANDLEKGVIPGISWDERGPNNVGGRTRALMFDPNDGTNQKMYAGSVGGGLWFNNNITNPGSQWTKVNDFWDNLAITALAYDPATTTTFYAGTGEGFGNADAIRGNGIWKSTNGGASWAVLPSTSNNNAFRYVKDIKVVAGNVVLAATNNGVYRSTNGGSTWAQVQNGTTADLEVAANGDIYVSVYNGVILKSTDNGVSFATVLSGTGGGRVEIGVAASNANVLYAVAAGGAGSADCEWIKRSSNAGATWTTVSIPNYREQGGCANNGNHFTRGQSWYDLILHVNPADEDEIIVGGIDLHRSTNGGNSWTGISYWTGECGDYVHADIHEIISNPGNPNSIAVGCDGGVFYGADAYSAGTPNFNETNNGYNVTQYYAGAIHPAANSNYMLAGAQDNGTQRYTTAGINSTTSASGGDGGYCHIDDNGTVQISSYVYNNYYISTNSGGNFFTTSFNNDGRFINPTDYDSGAQKLYAANTTGTYFRWDNPAAGGNASSIVSVGNFPGIASAVYASPNVANRVYFGFDNGTLVYVDGANNGANHAGTVIRTGSGYLNSIDIEAGNENHILITYSNYGVQSVFETLNGGTSWTNVEGNIPDMPVYSVLFDPTNADRALVGTELGVWSTDNLNGGSTNWGPTNGGLANVRVDMLQKRVSDATLMAATHGRGVFTSTSLSTPTVAFTSPTHAGMEANDASGTTGACNQQYTQLNVPIGASIAPNSNVTVTVSVDGASTATLNEDYEIANSSVTLTAGSTQPQNIVVNIIDDAIIEGAETVILNLNVVPNGANATAGIINQTTITISDNDTDPTIAGNIALLTEDFSGGLPGTWSLNDLSGGGNWKAVNNTNTDHYNYGGAINSTTANDNWMVFPSDLYGADGNAEEATLNLPTLNCANATNVMLNFEQYYREFQASSTFVDVSTDGINYTPFNVMANNTFAQNDDTTNPENAVVDISSVADGQAAVYIRFRFVGNYDYWWQIDDVAVMADVQTNIESSVNTTRSGDINNGDVLHFFGPDGEIIATVKQTGGADMGCIVATVEREGTGKQPSTINNGYNVADKTIHITADNPTAPYEVTLYYTTAELATWGGTETSLFMMKSETPIGTEAATTTLIDETPTITNIGIGYTYTSSFTGFSSFTLTNLTAILPLELLDFKAEAKAAYNHLNWRTTDEVNVANFEIHRSLDGRDFEKIGAVNPGLNNYTYDDKQLVDNQINYYYKLKMVDIDGQFTWSPIVSLRREQAEQTWEIYPNPVRNQLTINTDLSADAYEMYHMNGQLVAKGTITNQTTVDCSELSAGVYLLQLQLNGKLVGVERVVKQ